MNVEEIKQQILKELDELETKNKAWLDTQELSKFLNITRTQLEAWRREGFGPSYLVLGKRRILYPKSAIAEFVVSNQVKTM
ncbi:MAG: helix-turn-helix domain-containing protein [Aliarcobacter skirrowii]|uniref:helix-turn-helix transcriptional regulator n=1 Tax=Aliarcobacter skirrowii TaxID=28200 RepID=UPI002430CE0D|nr:helix-turn-helix domain-containing protein [Aliarcobacter skirrowii]MDD2508651.1 helix-turn-helix domain-containing protein [Aliarcobacter skirrowii]MDD3496863.1 helix-turn-helix domain-containing protein [Aliarcobacter skirrowii]